LIIIVVLLLADMRFDLTQLPTDIVLLHKMVRDAADLLEASEQRDVQQKATISTLTRQLSLLRRGLYGRSSEQVHGDQLRLALEPAVLPAAAQNDNILPVRQAMAPEVKRRRKPIPSHIPRRDMVHMPKTKDSAVSTSCAMAGHVPPCNCGGKRVQIGADSGDELVYIPARFEVVRHIRPKLACRACESIVQAPAPDRPITASPASPSLLAHILVSRFCDHLPYYRQSAIFGRSGLDISRNRMVDWAQSLSALLAPLVDRMATYLFSAAKIHGDDTPVAMLVPGSGKTGTARFWVYLRDDRCSGSTDAPAVLYRFSTDRKSAHPQTHLRDYQGYFQADAYRGYEALYRTGHVHEVGCWSHVRRKFHDIYISTSELSPIAAEALLRIGALFDIERHIRGCTAGQRRRVRQRAALPRLAALKLWFQQQRSKLSAKSALAIAIDYAVSRWAAMVRYTRDGRLEISNNLCENALRGVSIGRKNWLFVGSREGGETAALFYSLVETCRMNEIDVQAYLTDLIARIGAHPINRINELLPWHWAREQDIKACELQPSLRAAA
jgi:transposase